MCYRSSIYENYENLFPSIDAYIKTHIDTKSPFITLIPTSEVFGNKREEQLKKLKYFPRFYLRVKHIGLLLYETHNNFIK